MWCPLGAVRPLSPLWLLVALALHAASPQLFDVRVPLVYEDPLKLSALRPTYFGYSVLLYSRNNYTWLQVGAPRSNCSNMPGISEPGRVYRCKPGEQCQLVLLDKTKNFDNVDYWDRKDGSWLGATMAIHPKADKMVVCAPRWMNQVRNKETKNGRDWLMQGACYATMASDPELLSASADKLIPLLAEDHRLYTQKNWGSKFVYDYGMGQAGISAYFTHERHDALEVDKLDKGGKGGKAEQLQLVLGAPGVLNWRGSSVLLTARSLPSFVNRRKRDFFGNDDAFDPGVIPFMLETKNAHDGDYTGYSSVCGHFFSKGELLHVAGAPRGDNYMGKVYLYEFPARSRQAPKIRTFLRGDSMGSYFGAALGAADITGDGLDDLLVGAPHGVQPKVHLFLGNKWGALLVPPTGAKFLLMPQWGRFSRFGISIATADINQDGYSDVLVGAPEAEDGCGGVAIYLGSKTGLRETPHQEILAETIAPGLGMRGFGISIAPPVDIDANSLPDVAIGAYLSGHVVLLRARARAQLTATLVAEERLQRESKSLKIKACMLYFHKLQATQTITVSRVLTVDSAFGRAYMLGTHPSSFKYNHTRDLTADQESCQIIDIVIKPDVQNFQDPLEITLNVTLLESQDKNNPVIITNKGVTGMDAFNRMTPVIESGQGAARINLPFSTNCGDDNICSSELIVNAHFPDHSKEGFVLGSTGSIVFEISMENRGEPAYVAQVKVTLMAPASLARLPPYCRADPDIICNMGNPLLLGAPPKILRLEIDMRGVSDTSRAGEKLEFIVEALTKSDDKEKNLVIVPLVFKVDARVDIAGKSLQDTYSYSQLENSTSMGLVHFKHLYEVQKFGLSPVKEAELIVHLPYKYQYKGTEITFVQIFQPEGFQAGQPFYCQNMDNYMYAIDTDQQITLHEDNYEEHSSSINTVNSTGINNSSGVDYTMKIKIKRSIRKHNTADYFIPLVDTVNSDELESAVESHARVRREAQSEESLLANRTVRLSCAEPGVSCHTMRCVIGPFRRQQHVARLLVTMALNITALKDTIMGVKDILVLGSDGLAAILGEDGKAVSEGSQARVRSVFISSPPKAHVELWIIAFSIILGMLLLLIVAMGLVKAGFFERKKKEELQALKEAEATQDAAETEEVWTEENQKEEEDDFKVDER